MGVVEISCSLYASSEVGHSFYVSCEKDKVSMAYSYLYFFFKNDFQLHFLWDNMATPFYCPLDLQASKSGPNKTSLRLLKLHFFKVH